MARTTALARLFVLCLFLPTIILAQPRYAASSESGWHNLKQASLGQSLAIAPATTLLSNASLSLNIIDDGRFSLATTGGRYLLFPNPATTFLSIKIGQTVYTNWDNTLRADTPPVMDTTTTAHIVYHTNENIQITQTYALSGDALKVTFDVSNQGTVAQDVAIRLLLDTQVDQNDGSPLYAPTVGVRLFETDIASPSFKTAYGYDIYPDPTLRSAVSLVTSPNRMVFAHWPTVIGFPDHPFGATPAFPYSYAPDPTRRFYTPGFTDSPSSDSCILLYFELGSIAPQSSKSIVTAYGLSEYTDAADARTRLIQALRDLDRAAQLAIEDETVTISDINGAVIDVTKPNIAAAAFDLAFDVGLAIATPQNIATLIPDYVALKSATTIFNGLDLGTEFASDYARVANDIPDSASKNDIGLRFANHYQNRQAYNGSVGTFALSNRIHTRIETTISQLSPTITDSPLVESTIQLIENQAQAINASHPATGYNETVIPIADPERLQSRGIPIGALYKHRTATEALVQVVDTNNSINIGIQWTKYGIIGGAAIVKVVSTLAIPITVGGSTFTLVASEATIWTTPVLAASALSVAGSAYTAYSLLPKSTLLYELIGSNTQFVQEMKSLDETVRLTTEYVGGLGIGIARTQRIAASAGDIEIINLAVPDITIDSDAMVGAGIGSITARNNGTDAATVSIYGTIQALLPGFPPATVGLFSSNNNLSLAPGQAGTLDFSYSALRSSGIDARGYLANVNAISLSSNGMATILGPFTANFFAGTTSQLGFFSPSRMQSLSTTALQPGQKAEQTIVAGANSRKLRLALVMPQGSDFDLHIFDSQNQHVGLNYSTGIVDLAIPKAVYSGSGPSTEMIDIPVLPGQSYRVEVVALSVEGGDAYQLLAGERQATPAQLDVSPKINLSFLAQAGSFNVTVSEYSEVTGITNVQAELIAQSWSGAPGLPPTITITGTPDHIDAGARMSISGIVQPSSSISRGRYTGILRITGKDANSNATVLAEAEVSIDIVPPSAISIPLIQR